MTTTTTTPRVGTLIDSVDRPHRYAEVIEMPQELRPIEGVGMFCVRFPNTGVRFFAMLTGRTRKFDRYNTVPTVMLFDIETVADENGVLWGDPGDKLTGTWYAFGAR